jgi:hypothetical protein
LDRGTKALRIGSLTHKLLEQYNIARENGEDHEPEQPPEIIDDEWMVAEKLYWAYRNTYKDEVLTIIQPEVEVHFRFGKVETPTTTWEIYIICTLDGVVEKDSHKYMKEYKTCANLGAAQFARFLNDFQITTYMYAAVKGLDFELDGAIITLLPKTKYPTPARLTVTRNAHQYQEWEKTVLFESRNLIHCMENDYFPQRQINCTKWNRACIFHDFCITGEDTNLVDLEIRDNDYADRLRKELMVDG